MSDLGDLAPEPPTASSGGALMWTLAAGFLVVVLTAIFTVVVPELSEPDPGESPGKPTARISERR